LEEEKLMLMQDESFLLDEEIKQRDMEIRTGIKDSD